MKKREKSLDSRGVFLYYIGARVRVNYAQYAMKWEIASKGGNFHRVCPVIGRLRTEFCRRIYAYIAAKRECSADKTSAFFRVTE